MTKEIKKNFEVNQFGEVACKCYRILGGKLTGNRMDGNERHVSVVYDNNKPLYASSSYNEAAKMFERFAAEGYREHMLFVVDFGVLDVKSAVRFRLNKAQAWSDDYRSKAPCLTIAEYSIDMADWLEDVQWNKGSKVELVTRGLVQTFDDIPEALRKIDKLRRLSAGFSVNIITQLYKGENKKKMFTRKRTLVTNRWLQNATNNQRYVGCGKIECNRSFTKIEEAIAINDDGSQVDDWVE